MKLETRAIKCIHVGYEADFTYRYFDPTEKKIIITRNVRFDEMKNYFETEQNYNELDQVIANNESDLQSVGTASEGALKVGDDEANVAVGQIEAFNYKQAISGPDAGKWREALNHEYKSLIDNETWQLEDLPADRRAITSKWVYKIKYGPNNTIARYRARLVARGFTRRAGIDYTETFSPVVRMESIRMLLVVANQLKLKMLQIDVKTAFLNRTLEETMHMSRPEGYENGSRVCKLNKSIHGLKQSCLAWNECFTKFLREFKMQPLKSDCCVFVNTHDDVNATLIVCIYVDDGLSVPMRAYRGRESNGSQSH